jgi:hypothetical protein
MDNYRVYAGNLEVQFFEEELDDSEPDQAIAISDSEPEECIDLEQEKFDDDQAHGQSKYNNLIDLQRNGIYDELLARSADHKLPKNAAKEVANMFQVTVHKFRRFWRRLKKCYEQGLPIDVRSRKPKNCGCKRIEVDLSMVPGIPQNQRSTLHSLERILSVKKSTLHKIFTEGLLDRHSSSLKTYLKEAKKKARLQFCISMFDQQSLQDRPTFKDMRNIIH